MKITIVFTLLACALISCSIRCTSAIRRDKPRFLKGLTTKEAFTKCRKISRRSRACGNPPFTCKNKNCTRLSNQRKACKEFVRHFLANRPSKAMSTRD